MAIVHAIRTTRLSGRSSGGAQGHSIAYTPDEAALDRLDELVDEARDRRKAAQAAVDTDWRDAIYERLTEEYQ